MSKLAAHAEGFVLELKLNLEPGHRRVLWYIDTALAWEHTMALWGMFLGPTIQYWRCKITHSVSIETISRLFKLELCSLHSLVSGLRAVHLCPHPRVRKRTRTGSWQQGWKLPWGFSLTCPSHWDCWTHSSLRVPSRSPSQCSDRKPISAPRLPLSSIDLPRSRERRFWRRVWGEVWIHCDALCWIHWTV